MSCIAILIPYAYIAAKTLMVLGATGAISSTGLVTAQSYDLLSKIDMEALKNGTLNQEDMQKVQNALKTNFKNMQEEFVTTFVNEDLLLKTLEEYGDFNVEKREGKIVCSSEVIDMEFYKTAQDEPYRVRIYSKCDCETIVNDINEEYGLNVQEQNYNNLKERLERENLQIGHEEVLEDNTIVLTINLG